VELVITNYALADRDCVARVVAPRAWWAGPIESVSAVCPGRAETRIPIEFVVPRGGEDLAAIGVDVEFGERCLPLFAEFILRLEQ